MKLNHGHFGHMLTKKLKYNSLIYNAARRRIQLAASLYASKESGSDSTKEMDSLANGSNAVYIDRLYTKWSKNHKSVHPSWDTYFSKKSRQPTKKTFPPRLKQFKSNVPKNVSQIAPPNADWKYIDDHLVVQAIIRAYQTRGHLAADLDPLGIVGPTGNSLSMDNKRLQATKAVLRQHYTYAFNDLNSVFKLPMSTLIGGHEKYLPLQEILSRLERTYCGHVGVEYMMITSFNKCNWIRTHFEKPGSIDFQPEEKKLILERLTRATAFENFLAKKFTSEKRFGLEGCDIMIPIMKEIIDVSNKIGVESVYIGMAHRGRLNVLANVCRRPIVDILSQFHGLKARDSGSGDVKYHLGLFTERLNRQTNRNVRITVVANPSHLEHVNPVVLGKARSEMFLRGDYRGDKVLPIILHGDASFCGQGVVYESIHMSDLPSYTTYGTIHIVTNNQVGFTTDPRFSRSSRYCTDVARVVNAPIFHVNADDPEACIHCARVAAKWRAKFHKDVVIDIVGYRRNGHNEADEPMFTQPLMYQRIQKTKPCVAKYADQLVMEGVIQMEEYNKIIKDYEAICNKAWDDSQKVKTFKYSHWLDSPWSGFFQGRDRLKVCPTGVDIKVLEHIGKVYSTPPPPEHKFEVHRGILRILSMRMKMVEAQVADWSLGEAFAFGTLLKDGIHVRLSGQDVERGTFSHRHHVLYHQSEDKTTYNSLEHLYPDQADYDVCNSSLSECAILGFELGYAMSTPYTLVIWEAQFGDFANTAQAIIDTFLASGETKWVRQCALCMFLPHSMEGMGPEHSSGRIERFLQMSDDDPEVHPDTCDPDFNARQIMSVNWIITNISTPANLFHVLRRQVAFGFRKPLINFSPKSVLRHPMARSPFKDFDECSAFQRIIPETGKASEHKECVKKLVFCSGKVYYDLLKERDDHEQVETVALVRLEQICPFPYDVIEKEIAAYPKAELLWAQEEHKNQGAWTYVQQRFDTALIHMEEKSRCIVYHGRPPNSASSTGNKVQHYTEYDCFIKSIFGELTEENKKRMADMKKKEQAAAIKATEASLSKAKKTKAAAAPKPNAAVKSLRPAKEAETPKAASPPPSNAMKEVAPPAKKLESPVDAVGKGDSSPGRKPLNAEQASHTKTTPRPTLVTKPQKNQKPATLPLRGHGNRPKKNFKENSVCAFFREGGVLLKKKTKLPKKKEEKKPDKKSKASDENKKAESRGRSSIQNAKFYKEVLDKSKKGQRKISKKALPKDFQLKKIPSTARKAKELAEPDEPKRT